MWYVEFLLINSPQLKEKHDFDSNEYNDLLLVEKVISYLRLKDILSSSDINTILNIFPKRRFKEICDIISYTLGGKFTNEGYILYLKTLYNLTDQQEEVILNFMKSSYRHCILRNPIGEIDAR